MCAGRRTALRDVNAVAAGLLYEEIARELGLRVVAEGTLARPAGLERRRAFSNVELIEAVGRVGRRWRVEEAKPVALGVRDGNRHCDAYVNNDEHLGGPNP